MATTHPLYVGAISGTSVDGLDLALLEDGPRPRILAGETVDFPFELRQTLLRLSRPGEDGLDALGLADAALGQFIGHSVNDFLRRIGTPNVDVRALGSHGQTVRHRPQAIPSFTVQIGDPNRIAEITGITTVADFRRRDMAAGGQGAPLVPLFHRGLFGAPGEARAVLNIGGIANLTLLPSRLQERVRGFDTGPGNGLMDAWIADQRGEPFDRDGIWGAGGAPNERLLDECLADPYFSKPPPKSTGREYFHLDWLRVKPAFQRLAAPDIQATLRCLTAQSVASALNAWGQEATRVIVCGGGRRNGSLMRELSARLRCDVETSEAFGVDGDSLEAAAFAWLAARRLALEPGNEPAVTGAMDRRVLGAIYPA
ncbi:MAG: anhydro-N-acetylmuramic acid kinase [Pseudomonadales bacterium]